MSDTAVAQPAYSAPGTLTPILTSMWGVDRSWTLDVYRRHGGYEGLAKAKKMQASEIVELVKASGLRGRGGAGFPTGLKWSFLPAPDGKPRYLVVNADESEPGTCKDIPTIMGNPHALIEGVAITSRAIGCDHAFVYLRGEVSQVYRRLLAAAREAMESGLLDTGFGLDGKQPLTITAHAG
ncbi:MAG: NADH-quinone oxidoreductase subunit F, partial [Actinomyces graevenitzii]|nr:NADH-quinone oxidoreductase subunit F [Actinomyces graevenitzii]